MDAESATPYRFPVELGYENADSNECLETVSKAASLMEKPSLDGQFAGPDQTLPSISLQNKVSASDNFDLCLPSAGRSVDLPDCISTTN